LALRPVGERDLPATALLALSFIEVVSNARSNADNNPANCLRAAAGKSANADSMLFRWAEIALSASFRPRGVNRIVIERRSGKP
jgi:hypothetical protein